MFPIPQEEVANIEMLNHIGNVAIWTAVLSPLIPIAVLVSARIKSLLSKSNEVATGTESNT